jgi:hypothetical protein
MRAVTAMRPRAQRPFHVLCDVKFAFAAKRIIEMPFLIEFSGTRLATEAQGLHFMIILTAPSTQREEMELQLIVGLR